MPVRGYARGILPQLSDFQCYVDASFAGDVDTRRSTTGGYIFKICGGPVLWQSRMQPSVALYSMKAEYMAASAAAQKAMWMNRLLQQLGFKISKPITFYEDNKAAIYSLQIIMEITGDLNTFGFNCLRELPYQMEMMECIS